MTKNPSTFPSLKAEAHPNGYESNTSRYQAHITPVSNRLKGKTALITGAARGIGKAIALRFAQEGAGICIVDKDLAEAEQAAHEVESLGPRAAALQVDVSDRSRVEEAVVQMVAAFGCVDILVNNAGVIVFGSLMDCRLEDWNRMMAVDLAGAFSFTQLVGRQMIKRGCGGRMLHVGSTASLQPAPQQFAYSVAKAGLMMMSRCAALELAHHNITSNLLCPHGAVTDINRDLLSDPAMMQAIEEKVPAHRLSSVEEISAAAAFLVSGEAAYITGAELVLDGGSLISALWWRQ